MDDKLRRDEQDIVDNEPDTGVAAEEASETADEPTPEEWRQKVGEALARADELYGRLARLQADFENYRRRTRKEKEELWKYASEQIIVALLPVLDNFERALAAGDNDPARVIEGVGMIYRQLQEVLTREGLSPIPARGEIFDPACHEAMMQQESGEHPDNTVLEELQKGYYLKDKVIRPAMVKVARNC